MPEPTESRGFPSIKDSSLLIGVALKGDVGTGRADPLIGDAGANKNSREIPAIDQAALEVALSLKDSVGAKVLCCSVATREAKAMLSSTLDLGADRAVLIVSQSKLTNVEVAVNLAGIFSKCSFVFCGSSGLDLATSSVPGLLAAALKAKQALGISSVSMDLDGDMSQHLSQRIEGASSVSMDIDQPAQRSVAGERASSVSMDLDEHGTEESGSTDIRVGIDSFDIPSPSNGSVPTLVVERKFSRGKRERLRLTPPGVVSLEPQTARLRRAPLNALLDSKGAEVELISSISLPDQWRSMALHPVRSLPYRPRTKLLLGPGEDLPAKERIAALLAGAATAKRSDPIHMDPQSAARLLLQAIANWEQEKP